MFDFDPDTHTYTLDGRVLPSVTQILAPYQKLEDIPADVLAAAAEFGTHVHAAAALFTKKSLDWSCLDPQLVPYVEGVRNFLKDTEFQVLRVEHRMFHRQLGYAGTLDLFGVWKNHSWIVDYTSADRLPRTKALQTAAYDDLLRSNFGGRPNKRATVHLVGEGKYRVHVHDDKRDYHWWASALNLHTWMSNS